MTTRYACIEDLPQLAILFDQYRVFYKQPTDIPAAQSFLQERIEKKESVIIIAVEENSIAGFTQLYPIFSSVSMKKAWLLNDLFVQKDKRGKGVAAALLAAAKNFGKETNAKFLLLQTGADNFTAQSVYEKNNWKKSDDYYYELAI